MRKTLTATLLTELNTSRGLTYPDIGYAYYADIRGDGRYNPSIWTIVTAGGGGVTRSDLNGRNPRDTCARIRAAIAAAVRADTGMTLAHNPARPWFPAPC